MFHYPVFGCLPVLGRSDSAGAAAPDQPLEGCHFAPKMSHNYHKVRALLAQSASLGSQKITT